MAQAQGKNQKKGTNQMTKDEISALQVGRELDALVAEKVMNLCIVDSLQLYGSDCVASDKCMDEWLKHPMYGKTEDPDSLEPYSAYISAAWEVVEKMQVNFLVSVYANPSNIPGERYTVHMSKTAMGLNLIEIDASTAPEAICKAALLAVMDS